MHDFKHLLRQGQELLHSLGIHPLVFAAGLLFCLFFPRFFLLGAIALGTVWVLKNIGFRPKKGPKSNHK